jgi:hypothetical protein
MPCFIGRAKDQLIMRMKHNHAEETTWLGAILCNPHAIVEDWESSFVMTVEQLNWSDSFNSIATVEKVREPMLDVDLAWM